MTVPKAEEFTGKWRTRAGFTVYIQNATATVIESEHKYIIGWAFPIKDGGKCPISPDLDLIERFRDSEGYEV